MICRTSNKSRPAGETRVNDETTGRQARPFHMRVFIRFLHFVFLLTRGATLGVRAACFDEKGRIFMVRHTYLPGWYLPGGGVERGETLLAALHKEIREEGNLEAASKPELFHVYLNLKAAIATMSRFTGLMSSRPGRKSRIMKLPKVVFRPFGFA